MTTSRMFPFINKTWNPIAGGPCPYNCYGGGCWATMLKEKHGWEKYKGPWRVHPPEMRVKFKPDDFVFVCDMIDIGHSSIPIPVVDAVINHIKKFPETDFLMLTKNPRFYNDWTLPRNVTIGATVETNIDIPLLVSLAPQPYRRLQEMHRAKEDVPLRRFISVEPIMKFNQHFADLLIRLEPWAVAVGYDNYDNGLSEPSLNKTSLLIEDLDVAGITVYRKTLREARR